METVKVTEKFGVKKVANDRYAIVKSWKEKDERGFGPTMDVCYDLTYKNPQFALKKAESFVKALYHDHVSWNGLEKFVYEFVNLGIIEGQTLGTY